MIIAMCGQKGGSGKTTTSIAVAAELLARGKRVLLVDADPQGTARTWADVAAEAGHATPTVVAMGGKMHLPGQLDALAKSYDFTVIDCPPRHDEVHRAALMVADLAVVPCGPSAADVWGMTDPVELINEARVVRPDLRAVVLITRKDRRTAIGTGARKAVEGAGLPVLRTELCARVAYQEAPAAGLGVAQYAPLDAAAVEVRCLVDELLKELSNGKETHDRAEEGPAGRRAGRARAVRGRDFNV